MNFVFLSRFAESHNCENLEKVALAYVHRHFPQVCESEEFLDTPKDIVIQFLESENVKVDSEFQVFICIKNILNEFTDLHESYCFLVCLCRYYVELYVGFAIIWWRGSLMCLKSSVVFGSP